MSFHNMGMVFFYKNRRFFLSILPLVFIAGMAFFLLKGLALDPHAIPSVLIGKSAPEFALPDLFEPHKLINNQWFRNEKRQWHLVNFWSSWCRACRNENPVLLELARQGVSVIGIDYKDDPKKAQKWLSHYANPYQQVLLDANGLSAERWGVYGTPETFLVDPDGIVRYKNIGPMTLKIWRDYCLPLMQS